MARITEVAARTYAAGTHGPFTVDGFAHDDTDWLAAAFSVDAWPVRDGALIEAELRWSTGEGRVFSIPSPPRDRQGKPLPHARVRIDRAPPSGATSATLTLRCMAALRMTVVFVAGARRAVTP